MFLSWFDFPCLDLSFHFWPLSSHLLSSILGLFLSLLPSIPFLKEWVETNASCITIKEWDFYIKCDVFKKSRIDEGHPSSNEFRKLCTSHHCPPFFTMFIQILTWNCLWGWFIRCKHTHICTHTINLYILILSPLDYVPSSLDLALNDKFEMKKNHSRRTKICHQ